MSFAQIIYFNLYNLIWIAANLQQFGLSLGINLYKVAQMAGVEPAANGLEVRCSMAQGTLVPWAATNKRSWEKLREKLEVEQCDIEYIKSFADPVRYGGTRFISCEEYKRLVD